MQRKSLFRLAGVLVTLVLLATGIQQAGAHLELGRSGPRQRPDDATRDFARKSLEEGQRTFRYDTFGDEEFWGGTLQLNRAIAGSANGGVGGGVSPRTALAVGLKVDVDALPPALRQQLLRGEVNLDDPAVTLALLKLDAVVGVKGFFDANGGMRTMGIQCALCHSTVDDALAPGVGHRLDGWANRDLDVGAIVGLAPNLQPVASLLGVSEGVVRTVLASWGPGKFDASLFLDGKAFRPDGKSAAVLIPPAFGLQGVNLHTWTGWGSLTYWNAFVANLEMHGKGEFFDPRLDDASRFPVAAAHGSGHVHSAEDRITPKLPALQYYQLSLPAPAAPEGSFEVVSARRGATLFAGKARCASCHTAGLGTEPGWNMHRPEDIGIDGFQASRSPDGAYRTAPLKGLWTHMKGGFYHDGRFATLREVIDHYDSFFALGLADQEKTDVAEYLKTLSDDSAPTVGDAKRLNAAASAVADPDAAPASTCGVSVWPAPAARGQRMQLAFLSPTRAAGALPADLGLGVYDVSGRRVASVPVQGATLEHGMVTLSWDGRSDAGAAVDPGIYFVRVSAPSAKFQTERRVVVR